MFLRHLYSFLDQVQLLEKGAVGTMAMETFLNSSFFRGPAMTAQGHQLRKEALLSVACLSLLTLGDDHLEVSVHYSLYRVRRQLGFDQGVPSSPGHGDSFTLHRVFWTEDSVLEDGRLLALALADKGLVGGLSKAYQNYWNRCFALFSRFHVAHHVHPKLEAKAKKPIRSRKGKGESSGPKVAVTVDDDDDGSAKVMLQRLGLAFGSKITFIAPVAWMRTLTKTNITVMMKAHTQIQHSLGGAGCLRHASWVTPFAEKTADRSLEASLDFPAAVTNTTQAAGKLFSSMSLPLFCLGREHLTRGEGYASYPSSWDFDAATGTTPQLVVVPPHGEITDDSHKDSDVSIITFQGAFVYQEMVAVLRKFMDRYGSFMEITGITSSFSRSVAFWALGLVLHGIDTMQLLDITDYRLLCWQDAICEAISSSIT
ncbi:hypothetical protein L3X38_003956 [Prunus dulcis]|uniref:Uncharacterized protein n=1 Tax=Prunus dulcis TaxID=3755 RepID=A0AAD5F2T6_PRUDU|nr:hypothetical protein L3X38_003956 [Prunus dulcis]